MASAMSPPADTHRECIALRHLYANVLSSGAARQDDGWSVEPGPHSPKRAAARITSCALERVGDTLFQGLARDTHLKR